jgi:hypothetical protein
LQLNGKPFGGRDDDEESTEKGGQTVFGFTVRGDYEGKEVALWVSMISGMEIISVEGREVSRKRSLGFSTNHDLSNAGVDADVGVVKVPCTLELHRQGKLVATFKHPTATRLLLVVSGIAAVVTVMVLWLLRR